MEGRPWLRLTLIVLVLLLAGIPVWRLTRSDAAEPFAIPRVTAPVHVLALTVRFAHAPESFEVTYLGKEIVAGKKPQTLFACPWSVALSPEGVDLLLKAQWPAGAPRTAVEVTITQGDKTLVDQTFWTEQTPSLTELVTVPGGKAP